jgi:hypothetical protein
MSLLSSDLQPRNPSADLSGTVLIMIESAMPTPSRFAEAVQFFPIQYHLKELHNATFGYRRDEMHLFSSVLII